MAFIKNVSVHVEFQFIVSSAELRRYVFRNINTFTFVFYISPLSLFLSWWRFFKFSIANIPPHIKQQIVHPFDVCFQSPLNYNRASASIASKECESCDVFINNHE